MVMKDIKHILLIFISLFLLTACNNDFLEENDGSIKYFSEDNSSVELEYDENSVQFVIPNSGNSQYKIIVYPNWLEPKVFSGSTKNNVITLDYSINKKYNSPQAYGKIDSGVIVVNIEGVGNVQIAVTLTKYGKPKLEVSTKELDFDTNIDVHQLVLSNTVSDAVLAWNIKSMPAWLSCNMTEGRFVGLSYNRLSFSCTRQDMLAGEYSDTIVIASNDKATPFYKISVKMKVKALVNDDAETLIQGIVKDSKYSKIDDKLYILTQSPHSLLIYDSKTKSVNNIKLPQSPNTLTLSEDGKKAFVGYSGLLSVIDLNTKVIAKSIALDFNVFSLAYGENNWCYASCTTDQYWGFYSINLQNSTAVETSYSSIYNDTYLLKVKNKPYIYGTRLRIIPNGLVLMNISDGKGFDSRYWHDSYGARIWSTENGDYLIGNYGIVIKTPTEETGSTVHELGRFSSDNQNYYKSFDWVDHNATKNILLAVESNDFYSNGLKISKISVYGMDGYVFKYAKNTLDLVATVNGVKAFYKTVPYFVFTNKAGTEAYAVKNIHSSYKVDNWSVEAIKLD